MSDLDNVVREFLVESYENLDQLDQDLVALEKDPRNPDRLASIFRTIHTIKGTAGFLEYPQLCAITHVGENLLARLRDGHLLLNAETTSTLLALVDAIRGLLSSIETTGREGVRDHTALMARLTRLHEGAAATGPLPEAVETEAVTPPDGIGSLSDGTVRVDVGLLDRLMTLVGELVLARNQMLQFGATQQDTAFLNASQRLNLITTELQEGVMKTRMQPIGNIWKKLPRVVRDLARSCGKQVRLDLEGEETELDRTILEAIKDPLTHLVRNAVDHGIETPATRMARGKAVEGRLLLRAFHEGGYVNIEFSDDGAGIDPARVRDKALERGLITRDQPSRLSERELLQLIFVPGFSTAERVTSVSGRGVGMDVVKTNIEKIGGTIDLQSQLGQGVTVKIKIPLTLAIVPALIVTGGGDRYAIPQVNLLELVRLEGERIRRGIEYVHGAPVYRLRGNLLPLIDLNRELGVAGTGKDEAVNIVVLQVDGRPFGLMVEAISDTEEIVVKPLAKLLKGLPLFAGATILGDGQVALILDVLGLAQSASVIGEVRRRALAQAALPARERSATQQLLLVETGADRRVALPLDLVARLEEVAATMVERAAGREVLQYRDRILPLVRLGSDAETASSPSLRVVVCGAQANNVGLVVERIQDVVEMPLEMQWTARRAGTFGSAVIQGRVTDLLDVPAILRDTAEEFVPSEGRSQP
jgi:two-component system chemotaxis sensor kinase CheA